MRSAVLLEDHYWDDSDAAAVLERGDRRGDKGVRTFTVAPEADGRTPFTVREEYTGALLGLMWRFMPDLGPSFVRFANGPQARVERGASGRVRSGRAPTT